IETNFLIMEDPSSLTTTPATVAFIPENQPITLQDYATSFADALAYMERLRPHLNTWIQSLRSQDSSSSNNAMTNYPSFMRITHHLSHVLHLLSDYSVDPSNANSPIGLNVL